MDLACLGKIIHDSERTYVVERTFHGKSVNQSLVFEYFFKDTWSGFFFLQGPVFPEVD